MQCDIYRNGADSSEHIPYLLDIQANLLAELETRVVVPLVRSGDFGRPVSRLHPVFNVRGERVVMATHLIAAVHRKPLGTPVASLSDQRDTIMSAIDVLWSGV